MLHISHGQRWDESLMPKRSQDIHIRKELRLSARDNADSFYTFLSRHIFSVPDVEMSNSIKVRD